MNWDQVQSEWDRYSAHMQDRWGRLTEDDVALAQTGRSELIDRLQARYRIEKDLAERHVDGWLKSFC
jgi:uncharacterized protein YjbJ (UPF0337 family)